MYVRYYGFVVPRALALESCLTNQKGKISNSYEGITNVRKDNTVDTTAMTLGLIGESELRELNQDHKHCREFAMIGT